MSKPATSEQISAVEPIAIVGMGCRFPGSGDLRAFWRLLRDGVDAIGELPEDRFDAKAFFDPRPGVAGKYYCSLAGVIDGVEEFDNSFFGISPREAQNMDPQQRILLEVAWEAIEDAGLRSEELVGSLAGVFVGMWINDFDDLLTRKPSKLDLYATTGGSRYFAPGRISYFLGLEGPSLLVDTACSSSLAAIHLACQSLRSGECPMALAGGANLLLTPQASICFSSGKMLSPVGRCKFGDASADGFVRSDGVGIVALKTLKRALADGDSIWAVIRGSAINNDGRSSGLAVMPGGRTQGAALRTACQVAGLVPADLDYVEAHGTGTLVGDPIELETLGTVLGEGGRPAERPCLVGSVKTNIGHTEGAAGVAGLMKVVLSLSNSQIPPSLHFETPNPKVPWDELPLDIPTELRPWVRGGRPRRAGINSFGLSGANTHVVLEEAPAETPAAHSVARCDRENHLLLISGHSQDALGAVASRYRELLAEEGVSWNHERLEDLCRTACLHRSHREARAAIVAGSAEELSERLAGLTEQKAEPGVSMGYRDVSRESKVVFVFSGQGGQWLGMGRELFAIEEVFRRSLERCDALVRESEGWSILDEIAADADSSRLDEIDILQPVVFAVQVGLATLWRSWGVEPAAVVGHSLGEVAAAHVCGALSLEDAVRVVTCRSRLLRQIRGKGTMVLVERSLEEAQQIAARYEGRVSVAVNNSPTSCVLAGEPVALEEILTELEAADVFCRRVNVDVAGHSPQIDPLLPELRQDFQVLAPEDGEIKFFSTVEGDFLAGHGLDAEYWARNIRETVFFSGAMESLLGTGHDLYLEIGPHPVLLVAIKEALGQTEGLALPSLRRDEAELPTMLESLGNFYCHGFAVSWQHFFPGRGRRLRLFPYPWQRQRFPLDELRAASSHGGSSGGHPFLGPTLNSAAAPESFFWEVDLSGSAADFLGDHRIELGALLPAVSYVELALSAAREIYGEGPHTVEHVVFRQALMLPEQRDRRVQLAITSGSQPDSASFRVLSPEADSDNAPWTLHAEGRLRLTTGIAEHDVPVVEVPRRRLEEVGEEVGGVEIYTALATRGYLYGPRFQGIDRVNRVGNEALGCLRSATSLGLGVGGVLVQPALLDAALHVLLTAHSGEGTYVPTGLKAMRIFTRPFPDAELLSYARVRSEDEDGFSGDVTLVDAGGRLVAEVVGLELKALELAAAGRDPDEWLYEVDWQPSPLAEDAAAATIDGTWLLFSDGSSTTAALSSGLAERGASVVEVLPAAEFVSDGGTAFLDPGSAEHYRRLFEALAASGRPPCRGVVHLWGCTVEEPEQMTAESLLAAQRRGVLSVLFLVQAASAAGAAPRLTLITRGTQPLVAGPNLAQAPLWGLARVVANEHAGLTPRRIDLEGEVENEATARSLVSEVVGGSGDEIVWRRGERFEARLLRYQAPPSMADEVAAVDAHQRAFRLELDEPGVLDDFELRPFARRAPRAGEVEVEVAAAGLNFHDVLAALGKLPKPKLELGLECAGTVTAVGEGVEKVAPGDKVIAIAPHAFGSYVTTLSERVLPKPEGLSFEAAATLPIAFATAFDGLVARGGLRCGERVLIHSAAGGVGLAAVRIAQALGAEVFATAGTEEKRAYLRSLGIRHVMDSRSLDFAGTIREITGGVGVDVVLNSLTDEGMERSLEVVAPYGRFVEIGKTDLLADKALGLRPFLKNLSYFAIDLEDMYRNVPARFGELFEEMLAFFHRHELEPLPLRSFPIGEVGEAFRTLGRGKHIGKIVVAVRDQKVTLATEGVSGVLRPNATYLITGGLGGIGLAMARWLVENGARHLVLLGRSGASSAAREVVAEIEALGAKVTVAAVDVSDGVALAALFERIAASMPPVRGIIHGAMVLDDGVLTQLDEERFNRVMAPKMIGAWHLEQLSRDLPLDFFVVFSSVASLIGSPGQGNYVAANAFLDALAHWRQAQGRPGLSINWGPWGEIGGAAQPDRGGRLALRGVGSFSPEEGLTMLGRLLVQKAPQVGVMPMDWQSWRDFYPAAASSSLFGSWIEETEEAVESGSAKTILDQLIAADPSEIQPLLDTYAEEKLRKVLGIASSQKIRRQPLSMLGMDSLMAIELRNQIERDLRLSVPITRLLREFDGPRLVDYLKEQLRAEHLLQRVDKISDHDVDTLLREMLMEPKS